jgi:NAD(P)-dependent dehydrogenase (short-subunit alcohol dehydrogenase family)
MAEGQVVLITGGAQGIGRYIAHTFAQAGARLAIADIGSLDKVSGELRDLDTDVLPVRADVTDEDQVHALMDQVAKHYGRIDVLVNNAAIVPHFAWGVPRWAAIRDMEKSFWDRVIGTNLGGTFLCTKHVIPHMEAQRAGHILNLYGGGGGTGAAAYVVSKDAIKTFTRFVAEEVRESNICVVALGPGGTIAHEMAPEEARQRVAGTDIIQNRFVLAADVGLDMSGHLLDLKEGRLVVQE